MRVQVVKLELHPTSQLQGHVENVIATCTASVDEGTPEGVGKSKASLSIQFVIRDNNVSITGLLKNWYLWICFHLVNTDLTWWHRPALLVPWHQVPKVLSPAWEPGSETPHICQCPEARPCFLSDGPCWLTTWTPPRKTEIPAPKQLYVHEVEWRVLKNQKPREGVKT